MAGTNRKSSQDYNIAWVSALPIERASGSEMLDDTHEEPEDFCRNETDENSYTWGRIHGHNIVIVSLPSYGYGKVNAAQTVTELLASLPHIKLGLLVGIGAGLPSDQHDIRLGDVVVSCPNGSNGGVIQYDLGKATADGTWQQVGSLNAPPAVLLRALARLQAEHERGRFLMAEYLSNAVEKNRYWGARFSRPSSQEDRLPRDRKSTRNQLTGSSMIKEELVQNPRPSLAPFIHYGTIASGDILVKNAAIRDSILERIRQTCLCIEMEAAGLMQKFPCIVIRGISDYADSRKNDDWQRYASATAAAFTKELLFYTPVIEVGKGRDAADIMDIKKAVASLEEHMADKQKESKTRKVSEFLQALYTCPYIERKDRNIEALDGTCQWFTQHPRFLDWLRDPAAKVLWASADPGCGKSVLAKYLVDKVFNVEKDKIVCYFFFKDDFSDQNRCTFAMNAILHQLFVRNPVLLGDNILEHYSAIGKSYMESFGKMWNDLVQGAASDTSNSVVCVFDALDECRKDDRKILIQAITDWHRQRPTTNLKFLITSRPYIDIKDEFHGLLSQYPKIHLSGESQEEVEQISQEIDIVLRHRIRLLSQKRSLTVREETYLTERFLEIPHRTYLWAHLTMDIVESTLTITKSSIKDMLASLPRSVEEAYERILNKSLDFTKTRLLLHLLLAAQRPLSVSEMSLAMSLTEEQVNSSEFEDIIEPVERFKDSMRSLCGLFVVVLDHHVYLLHQTAREFLLRKPSVSGSTIDAGAAAQDSSGWLKSFDVSKSHQLFAERCLWYLFTTGAYSYSHSFFGYCNMFWIFHFRQAHFPSSSSHVEMALDIFRSWSSNYLEMTLGIGNRANLQDFLMVLEILPISLIIFPAWFGCTSVVRKILYSETCSASNAMPLDNALWAATQAGYNEIVDLLLSFGSNGNIQPQAKSGEFYDPPIWCATNNYDIPTIKALLKHNVDLTLVTEKGYTLLHVASGLVRKSWPRPFEKGRRIARHEEGEVIELLVEAGANPGARAEAFLTPLHIFLEHRHGLCSDPVKSLKVLTLLSIPGMNIDEFYRETGGTLMRFAALGGCTICMGSLEKLGAAIDSRDPTGNTVLHDLAYSGGNLDCVRFALRRNTAIDCRNSAGLTPLMIAAGFGHASIVNELVIRCADISLFDIAGATPLMWALIGFSRPYYQPANELCMELWQHTYLDKRYTRSFETHESDWITIVNILLDAGADVNTKDPVGTPLIHLAAQRGMSSWLARIIRAGTNVDALDSHDLTPLMVLARNSSDGNEGLIDLLLEHSAES